MSSSLSETGAVLTEVLQVFEQVEDARIARKISSNVRKAHATVRKKEAKAHEIIREMTARTAAAASARDAAAAQLEAARDDSQEQAGREAIEARVAAMEAEHHTLQGQVRAQP
jgi:hypothetical protein